MAQTYPLPIPNILSMFLPLSALVVFAIMAMLGLTAALIVEITALQQAQGTKPARPPIPCERPRVGANNPNCGVPGPRP